MELDVTQMAKVQATEIHLHVKVCDSGIYTLIGPTGAEIAEREDYVPSFFPGEHFGDYLILNIDLETGRILNWKKPEAAEVVEAFEKIDIWHKENKEGE